MMFTQARRSSCCIDRYYDRYIDIEKCSNGLVGISGNLQTIFYDTLGIVSTERCFFVSHPGVPGSILPVNNINAFDIKLDNFIRGQDIEIQSSISFSLAFPFYHNWPMVSR